MIHDAQNSFATLLVTHQSQRVQKGSVFVAIKGMKTDGACYVADALDRGAVEIILENHSVYYEQVKALCLQRGVLLTLVNNARKALAHRAARAYGYPANKLIIIGITGTKGKTTTAWMLYHMFLVTGHSAALLSSVANCINEARYETDLTTQQPDYIHAFLYACIQAGVSHVVMEVAAQAISLYRIEGLAFKGVAWLNFGQEHGEFYATQEAYWAAKASLIDYVVPDGFVLLPGDEQWCNRLVVRSGRVKAIWTKGELLVTGLSLQEPAVSVQYKGATYACPQLMGPYNGANFLVALYMADLCGVDMQGVQRGMSSFAGVPGRFNLYQLPNGAVACIDYAHNPLSYKAILEAVRPLTKQLIIVCGAGGDRDHLRRPLMGALATQYGDVVCITSDNPRSEDAMTIAKQMMSEIATGDEQKVICELDRAKAIKYAYSISTHGSLLLLLGKGSDEYQLIGTTKIPFSERAILQALKETAVRGDHSVCAR